MNLKQISSQLRNIFSFGFFQKRYADGVIQVKTIYGHILEKKESFPYGFRAKAKKGKVFVLCQGGNLGGFELLPVIDTGDGPELNDGDAALYTEDGGHIICRDGGTVEINGDDNGGLVIAGELQTQLAKLTSRVDGIMAALQNSPTVPLDGGAAYKTGIASALSAIVDKENFGAIASKKVLHGNA